MTGCLLFKRDNDLMPWRTLQEFNLINNTAEGSQSSVDLTSSSDEGNQFVHSVDGGAEDGAMLDPPRFGMAMRCRDKKRKKRARLEITVSDHAQLTALAIRQDGKVIFSGLT